MKHNSFLISCFLLLVTTLSISCGKEGPAGPAGPAGPTGAQGPIGPVGTANVIYSPWMDVTYAINADTSWYVATVNIPKLDANMITRGDIKVYINWQTAADPFVSPIPYFDGQFLINVDFFIGRMELYSNVDPSTSPAKARQYRYVLIPGGTTANNKGIDWNDYKQVQKALGIHD